MSEADENQLTPEEEAYFADNEGIEPDANEGQNDREGEQVEASPEGESETDDQPERSKTVPHQALHAERLKRQEAERRAEELQRQWQTVNERLAKINEVIAPKQAQPDTPPNASEDPIAALEYLTKKQQETEAQRAEREKQEAAERERNAAIQQLDTAYSQTWREKLAEDQNAKSGYQHFVAALDSHFQMRGVTDPMQRNQLIMDEERAIAYAAMQQGKNPADLVLQQAKMYGWNPQAVEQQAEGDNGGEWPAPKPEAAQEIERRQKGQAAARSLSGASGRAGDNAMTPEKLANMSAEEFDAYLSNLSPAEQRRIMGG